MTKKTPIKAFPVGCGLYGSIFFNAPCGRYWLSTVSSVLFLAAIFAFLRPLSVFVVIVPIGI